MAYFWPKKNGPTIGKLKKTSNICLPFSSTFIYSQILQQLWVNLLQLKSKMAL